MTTRVKSSSSSSLTLPDDDQATRGSGREERLYHEITCPTLTKTGACNCTPIIVADAVSEEPQTVHPTAEGNQPHRIQRKRTKGWTMPPNTVYVGRPTKWGNPFRTTDNMGTRGAPEYWDAAKCVEMFRFTMCKTDHPGIYTDVELNEIDLNPLRGKDLACWCPLDQPCHADVLLELANA